MKNLLFIIAILSISVACDTKQSAQSNNQESSEVLSSSKKELDKSPCELVSQSTIKKVLSIPEDSTAEMKDVMRTYPSCFYKWENISFSKTKMVGTNEMKIDYPTEVTIVLVKNANEDMYQRSIKVYKDGQTQDGIGEMATWGDKMSQITFLSNGTMIHLHVQMSSKDSENKESALKIASKIVQNL